MSQWIQDLSEPWLQSSSDLTPLLGGKGASLWKLQQLGFAVPPGFTITTAAVEQFLSSGEWPPGLHDAVAEALDRLQRDAFSWTGDASRPLIVAVRSGAEESHPGLMRTIPYCGWTCDLADAERTDQGWREFAEFLAALLDREAPAECFSAREKCQHLLSRVEQTLGHLVVDDFSAWLWEAIASVACSSRAIRPFGGGACTAVTVQWMFPCDVAGVLFSRDPLHPDSPHMVIEAVQGTGMALLSGATTPWCGQLDRDTLQLVSQTAGKQPDGVSAALLEQLGRAALRLESEFNSQPVDLEWGCSDGRLAFFQVRPAREAAPADACFEKDEIDRLKVFARGGQRTWVRHQLSESLPHPTPLSWSYWRQFLSPAGGLGAAYRQLGFAPRRFPDGAGALQLIAGRIYADPDRVVQMICSSYPLRYSRDRLLSAPEHLQEPPTEFDPERLDPWFLLKLPHLLWVLLRSSRRLRTLRSTAEQEFRHVIAPAYRSSLADMKSIDVADFPLAALLTHGERCRAWLFDDWGPRLMLPGWLGVHAWQRLVQLLIPVVPKERIASAKLTLLNGIIPPQMEASELAPAPPSSPFSGELELATNPSGRTAITPFATAASINDESQERVSALLRSLDGVASPVRQRAIMRELTVARRFLPLREMGKQLFLDGLNMLRAVLQDIGRRTHLGNDLFFLTREELQSWTPASDHSAVIRRRRDEWDFWRRRELPLVVLAEAGDPLASRSASTPAANYERCCIGRSLAPGCADGNIWIANAGRPFDGAVVVARTIDATMVIQWANAAAFIVEQGGLLSHAAVTARRLGKPMVLVDGAVSRLTPGTYSVVDGDAGRVMCRSESVTAPLPPRAVASTDRR